MTGFDPVTVPIDVLAPHFDLYDPVHGARLWDVLDYAREHCPVLHTDAAPGYYIVTRYDDVRTVAEDPATYSSAEPGLLGTPIRMPPVTEDPPTHAEYRRQLNPYFARTALAKFEAGMRSDAAALVKTVSATGRMEFMNDFAIAITARNLAKVVLDEHDDDRLHRAVEAVTRISSEGTPEAFMDTAAIAEEFLRDRAANVSGQTRRAVRDRDRDGRGPPAHDGGAGGRRRRALPGRPRHHQGHARQHDAPSHRVSPTSKPTCATPPGATSNLDEFLRYETPVTFQARTVTQDTELNGCPLKAGDRIALHFAVGESRSGALREPGRAGVRPRPATRTPRSVSASTVASACTSRACRSRSRGTHCSTS